ncbi:MAG: hypothetical protein AMXMBFR53_23070 [Gemmatimonadota bacterium]
MRVVIFGATGMVGGGALREALDAREVEEVVTVGRRPTGLSHPKLAEVVHDDLFDYTPVRDRLGGLDACFFCLGVTSAGMREDAYRRVTLDLTVAAARALLELSPGMTFCFVSGAGTDSTERGRVMWARVKGAAENALFGMPFKAVYAFRPAFIQPLRGTRSRTRLYLAFYAVTSPLYPLLRRLFPRWVTDSVTVGRALIRVAAEGYPKRILENEDVNVAGARTA